MENEAQSVDIIVCARAKKTLATALPALTGPNRRVSFFSRYACTPARKTVSSAAARRRIFHGDGMTGWLGKRSPTSPDSNAA